MKVLKIPALSIALLTCTLSTGLNSIPAAIAQMTQSAEPQATTPAGSPQASRMKTITNAQRDAAAAKARAERVALRRAAKEAGAQRMTKPVSAGTLNPKLQGAAVSTQLLIAPANLASAAASVGSSAMTAGVPVGIPGAAPLPNGCQPGILDYFNCGNYANSPLPEITLNATGNPMLDANGNPVPVLHTGLRKFVNKLAGVGAGNKNELGNYIPIAKASSYPEKNGTSSDYYHIELQRYTQTLHSDLPPTLLQGYRDAANNGAASYLGPIIFARRDVPVRVKFTNSLPSAAQGKSFIPMDLTMKGAGNDANGIPYPQNRALLHLHGGVTPWISDGTPHQWITPAADGKKGVSQRNVPDMPDPGVGSDTWYWTNHQSSRMMWYHDHSYSMTRLNVYAGEVAPYILTEKAEDDLIASHLLPNQSGIDNSGVEAYKYGIPLVIQDKTFVPPTDKTVTNPVLLGSGAQTAYSMNQLMAEDPTWFGQTNLSAGPVISTSDGVNDTIMGQFGQLWFPHVFMPNQNANITSGVNNYGRWDYGAWVWPPVTGLTHKPLATTDPVSKLPIVIPPFPNPSAVQEAFMDTPLVNGTPYPTLTVGKKAYRFRVLNAANERHWNLQFYYAVNAAGNPCKGSFAASACTEVKMIPATPSPNLPATWPVDGRPGGVPDPLLAGPDILQIGNEGGFLPASVAIPSQPINYEYNRRVITALNVSNHALLIGPAERADIVVDFTGVPDGAVLIMYNDAPAPDPGFDTRLDYYTGDPDQSGSGGAPTTLPGYGPNTRTVMQFVVSASADASNNTFSASAFDAALSHGVYAAMQDAPLIPEKAYDPTQANNYAFIQDNVYDKTTKTFVAAQTAPAGDALLNLENKAIAEEFDTDWGRMTAQLGTELPFTNFLTQTTLQQWYFDPATEILNNGDTQIWKITHNGVDTHSIHFHLFNVQVINRVAWDGTMYPPDANELGWKESVRMNPLTDTIVALKPITPPLPFSLPDSYRPLDPTLSLNATSTAFTNIDPVTNNPITVTNELTNFGWEYVWHCHLLGHEENDMMRPMIIQVAPEVPDNFTSTRNVNETNTLKWVNTAASASGFVIQRATDTAFTKGLHTMTINPSVTAHSQLAPGSLGSYTDTTPDPTVPAYYRMASSKLFNNQVVSNGILNSAWTSTITEAPTLAPLGNLSPTGLLFRTTVLKSTASTQILTLFNNGTAPMTIAGKPTLSGVAANDFVVATGCPTSMAAHSSCNIDVSFAPTAASAPNGRKALLTVSTNDKLHPTLTASLSGTGTALKISASTLAFNSVLLNATATQTFTLHNVGTAPLTFAGTRIQIAPATGDYTTTNNCTLNTIPVGGCTVRVIFSPIAIGIHTGTLSVNTTDPAGVQTVALSGTGVSSLLVLSHTTLSFTSNQGIESAAEVVTISNTGGAPLNLASIKLGGVTPAAFGIVPGAVGACPTGASTLAVGAHCTATIDFLPTVSQSALIQPLSASLIVTPAAGSGVSQSVVLIGHTTIPAIATTPAGLTFTRLNAATVQSIKVTSSGTGPLSITSVVVSGTPGEFKLTNNCPVSVPSGSSCNIGVTYTPTSTGPKSATLTITTVAPAGSPQINLIGN